MGLVAQMLAGGIAGGADSISKSMDDEKKMDFQMMLERSRQQQAENLARLNAGLHETAEINKEARADAGSNVARDAQTGELLSQSELDGRDPSSFEYLAADEKKKADAQLGLIGAQTAAANARATNIKAGSGSALLQARLGEIDDMVENGEVTPEAGTRMRQEAITNKSYRGAKAEKAPTLTPTVQKEWGELKANIESKAAAKDDTWKDDLAALNEDRKRYNKPSLTYSAPSTEETKGLIGSITRTNVWPNTKQVPGRWGAEPGSASSEKPITKENNPGNMRGMKFDNAEQGVAAIDNQLKIYAERDNLDTIRGIMSKYSPSNENNVKQVVSNISKMTGLDPDKPLDMSNPATRAIIASAIIRNENSVSTGTYYKKTAKTASGIDLSQFDK